MTFKEYQDKAKITARYPVIAEPYVYPALGLAGETGEVLEKIKKTENNIEFLMGMTVKK